MGQVKRRRSLDVERVPSRRMRESFVQKGTHVSFALNCIASVCIFAVALGTQHPSVWRRAAPRQAEQGMQLFL